MKLLYFIIILQLAFLQSFGQKVIRKSERKTVPKTNIRVQKKINPKFKTLASGNVVYDDPVTDNEGNTYKTVKIGEQVWMAENLKYLPTVSPPSQSSDTEPVYYVYGYNGTNVKTAKAENNFKVYGVLYNWPAAMQACPNGWHLPSNDDWMQLANYIREQKGPYNYVGYDFYGVGNHLKAKSGWRLNEQGTDDYGFCGLPGGRITISYSFSSLFKLAYWWSSSEANRGSAWFWLLNSDNSYLSRYFYGKSMGHSVRCIKDN